MEEPNEKIKNPMILNQVCWNQWTSS